MNNMNKKRRIYYADYETAGLKVFQKEKQINMWGLISNQEDRFTWGVGIDNFFEVILKRASTIIFHNLSYDGVFVQNYLSKKYEYASPTDYYDRKFLTKRDGLYFGDYYTFNQIGGVIYNIFLNIKGVEISFRCSWLFIPLSVKKMGEELFPENKEKQKLKLDYNFYGYFKNEKDKSIAIKKRVDTFNEIPNQDFYYYSSRKDLINYWKLNPIKIQDKQYLFNDINIVKTYCKKYKNKIYELTKKRPNERSTSAGSAMKQFKHIYGEKKFIADFGGRFFNKFTRENETKNILNFDDWYNIKKSFYGGLTVYKNGLKNKLVEIKNGGYSYDRVKAYASIMETESLPYGAPISLKKSLTFKKFGLKILELKKIKITSFKMKDKYYNLGAPALIKNEHFWMKEKLKSDNSSYIYSSDIPKNKEYIKIIWSKELELLNKIYDLKYTEIKSYYFKSKNIFKEYIDIFKPLVINPESKYEESLGKRAINTPFGKMAEKWEIRKKVVIDIEKISDNNEHVNYDWFEDHKYYIHSNKQLMENCDFINAAVKSFRNNNNEFLINNNTKQFLNKNKTQFFLIIDSILKDNTYLSPAHVSSYIAWKGREELIKVIYNNLKIFLYADTDSGFFSAKPKISNIGINKKIFGKWIPENQFNKFKVLRQKSYFINSISKYNFKKEKWENENKNIFKVSGLKNKSDLNESNFKLGTILKNVDLKKINLNGTLFFVPTDFKLGDKIVNDIEKDFLDKALKLKKYNKKEIDAINNQYNAKIKEI